nr:MAG TPA: hypothetical protein [Caudoviricetes sp.]DAP69230.1 MAG TPA: hypothetical protein [Caudoviricetes sp.]
MGYFLCPYYSLAVKKIWRMPPSEIALRCEIALF